MAEQFLAAVTAALARKDPVEGCVESSEGGVVFTSKAGAQRLVPPKEVQRLAAAYASAADDEARAALVECACRAYVGGAADVPAAWDEARGRLLPQLWPLAKIAAKQKALPGGNRLPFCGLHGEPGDDLLEAALPGGVGVVVVCDFAPAGSSGGAAPSLETPVLSRDVAGWAGCEDWTAALRVAVDNLRTRTLAVEKDDAAFVARWEHHASGCGSSGWRDRYDAARCALLPSLVAKRKRGDGEAEPGAHVAVFAARGCVLASTARNALGLCYLGDVLHTKIELSGDCLSTQPYRLVKVKMPPRDAQKSHPLVQKAGEGVSWKWLPYAPSPTSGEFSVPTNQAQVEQLLACLEKGEPCPVFGETMDAKKRDARRRAFAAAKDQGNARFQAGDWSGAVASYDRAVKVADDAAEDRVPLFGAVGSDDPPRPLAAAHANAALCHLKLCEAADGDAKKHQSALALKRAMASAETDPTYAKAHDRCAKAFENLGEAAAAAESRALFDECAARDDAERRAKKAAADEVRAAKLAEREKKLKAREEAKQRDEEKRAKLKAAAEKKAAAAKQAAAAKAAPLAENSKLPKTTITLDGGAGLESLGIYGNGGLGLPSFIPGDAAPPSDPIYTASSPFVSGANFQ